MIRIIIFFFTLITFHAQAQYISGKTIPDYTKPVIANEKLPNVKYAKYITAEDLKAHLSILASDEFEGRETGKRGNDKAADYIATQFKNSGIEAKGAPNSFLQDVAFTFSSWDSTSIYIKGSRYKHLWDFLAFPSLNDDLPNLKEEEVIFLGYGIGDKRYNDYKGATVKGKTILIYNGDPRNSNNISQVTKTEKESGWDTNKKLEYAKKKGVKMVLIIESDIKQMLSEYRRKLLGGSMELGDKTKEEKSVANHVYISTTMAQELMAGKQKKVIKSRDRSRKKGKSCDVKLDTDLNIRLAKNQSVLISQNVAGYIEGSDMKDEIVVISAHYDHLGKKGKDIYNGADDNGSGTSAVLELADSFQKAKDQGDGPRRSLLFILMTGEEKGLLGSEYYAENPLLPLDKTIADVNIDMIGRVDKEHAGDPNYIYVIGSDRLSTDLHKINEHINQDYTQLMLDYTYNDINDPNRYYDRSDHFNFAKKGIPAIFFFSGIHQDYHRPTDTVEKIMFEKMEKISRHIFQLIWELANREERIKVDGEIIKP